MVKVIITYKGDKIKNIKVKDHAGYADNGQDLVCAGVSSICIGAMNAINEMYKFSCDLSVEDTEEATNINIKVLKDKDDLQVILNTIYYQLHTMEESYSDFIKVMKEEV